jgi:hypothetical protein
MTDTLSKVDDTAANLVTVCSHLDRLSVFIRSDGAGLKLIAQRNDTAAIARLLYRAADEMVARIPVKP